MSEPTPKHAKRRPIEEFCENTALPLGIITGGLIGFLVIALVFGF